MSGAISSSLIIKARTAQVASNTTHKASCRMPVAHDHACRQDYRKATTRSLLKGDMHSWQALVKKENEPITPFISKISPLLARGVSSILVMGGSGDYFGVSDTVLRMDCYRASDVTAEAQAIDQRFGSASALAQNQQSYGTVACRSPVAIYPGSPSGDSPRCTLCSHALSE